MPEIPAFSPFGAVPFYFSMLSAIRFLLCIVPPGNSFVEDAFLLQSFAQGELSDTQEGEKWRHAETPVR